MNGMSGMVGITGVRGARFGIVVLGATIAIGLIAGAAPAVGAGGSAISASGRQRWDRVN